jgi:sterol desaturase/sphingolipid hydroxylase (fatty acid hydroxylase superfamily)
MAGLVEAAWTPITERFSEATIFMAGMFLVHELVWFVCNAPYLLIEHYNLLPQYKIFKSVPTDTKQMWSIFRGSLLGHLIVVLPMSLIGYPLLTSAGFSSSVQDLPTVSKFLTQFVFFNILEDAMFYWIHRLMHVQFFFKNFHYKHHSFFYPYSLAGGEAHPVEFVFNFTLPIVLPPIICGLTHGTHILTFWAWLFFREMRSTEAHSGYILPWHLQHVLKYIGYEGSAMHGVHHHRKGLKTNFGSYCWWDRICGTYATLDSLDVPEERQSTKKA